jgi:hypothetical protein
MVFTYEVPLKSRRRDKSEGARAGVGNFFAQRNEIKQLKFTAKNCLIIVK